MPYKLVFSEKYLTFFILPGLQHINAGIELKVHLNRLVHLSELLKHDSYQLPSARWWL